MVIVGRTGLLGYVTKCTGVVIYDPEAFVNFSIQFGEFYSEFWQIVSNVR